MKEFLINILFLNSIWSYAQKPAIDSGAYSAWNYNSNIFSISNDGKYVIIVNEYDGNSTTTVRSTNGEWKKVFDKKIANPVFSYDGKSLIYAMGKDSLAILKLGTDQIAIRQGHPDFLLKKNGKGDWICYRPTNQSKNLVLQDVNSGRKIIYENVDNWMFSDDNEILLLWRSTIDNTSLLQWVNMNNGKIETIWDGEKINNPLIDSRHNQLAFKLGNEIWLYKSGSTGSVNVFKESSVPDMKFDLSYIQRFDKSGEKLFIALKERSEIQKERDANCIVEVWSYSSENLPSDETSFEDTGNKMAVVDLLNNRTLVFNIKSTDRISFPESTNASDEIALVSTERNFREKWSVENVVNSALLLISTGEIKKLDFLDNNRTVTLSASGKYLCYFNFADQDYYSYEIASGEIRNLTKGIAVSWIDIKLDDMFAYPREGGSVTWFKNDEALLVYDRYDIWRLDPLNKKKPVNLTNGYGNRNGIVFNLAFTSYNEKGVSVNDRIYLSAFNKRTKDNGFFAMRLNKATDPELLTMGPFIYNTQTGYVPHGSDFAPIKARNANVFLVRRMSAVEAPNYFSTIDFKTFKQLTKAAPENKYNWYTTELHTWKSLNGQQLQGILYKPADFDPNKKYPVIFQYYERKSDGLNAYIKPGVLSGKCNINEPTYVSQGYLIFEPDIYYQIGNPMQGTYDAVVSAARYVVGLPFVNSKKMGIQGCSFGGIQTNYLVTHTNLFAAAASVSGLSNLISAYGSLAGDGGYSQQDMFEAGQNRMGGTLWEKPGLYIKNSPIFSLYDVTTPLLIMHTKKDTRCSFSDAIQLFTGLRRLGKKSWMLVYSEGDHGLNGKEADDFSIRMMQFFDHYLKDKPAPLWMTKNMYSEKYRICNSFGYDTETPGPSLLKPAERLKIDSIMKMPLAE